MSGHSKWASIKHKKAIVDSRRGQAFTKLANLVAVAAREGADPETNYKLRLAVQKAKESGMPNANIERSIARGSGQLGGSQIEEFTYEGYGPGGAAIMIEVATDNRNRTAAEVRSTLSKHGGRMGESGSVAYQFNKQGVITVKADDSEAAGLAAIEAGAEDFEEGGNELVVYTKPQELDRVKTKLKDEGFEILNSELSYRNLNTVHITDQKTASQLTKLLDSLDELDDVTQTYSNFDIPTEILEAIA